jgi:two-component system, OmpR family, sensor histidine kinase ChvG
LKRSTASATATARTKAPEGRGRWFRLAGSSRAGRPEFDNLLDLYWGGPERRITGITVRIIGVNTLALLLLMLGIVYMGQYQTSVIQAHLETFQSEMALMTVSLSQANLEDLTLNERERRALDNLVNNLSRVSGQRIAIFNTEGRMIADSKALTGMDLEALLRDQDAQHKGFSSLRPLRDLSAFVLKFTPDRRVFPPYPRATSNAATDYPSARDALKGIVSLSVWQAEEGNILLTAGGPLYYNDRLIGAVLLERPGRDIERDIGRVWTNVLSVFGLTLCITIILSIYLSGTFARPLKKLAQAAEAVRKGQARAGDLPDFSSRHDEIGELSLSLRQMTGALWERMDSIEQFAADVAHELKNPLTSLRSAVETAAIVRSDADRKRLLDIIQHDVSRLDRLITDISNASRLDAELSRERFETIDLRLLLSHLIGTHQNPLERSASLPADWNLTVNKSGKTITLGCAGTEAVEIAGVQQRIGQVFQNLLDNALSFSPGAGTISVFVIPLKRRVSITVEDEGPGIPESKLETIFERFYSERPGHEEFGQHSGLGLSICKQIIEAHGGQIFAENIRGERGQVQGARFTVVLNRA